VSQDPVSQFLYHEACLMDENRYREWLALWEKEAVYWVPCNDDDIEIMERNQRGVEARGNDWQFIGRGMHRDKVLPDGRSSGFTMDECHLRGMWQYYGRLMSDPDATLPA